ncbi:MAG: recombinase family protein [Defluviitaleaceae bacterium]|nr:recombinase family protein [Defluviitaleaceae bacterium]
MAETKINLIPARRKTKQVDDSGAKAKTRVAAYARVSTDDQESSYEVQVEHYTRYINNNPEWKFVGVYADEGLSGTNAKKRREFQRMIDDCMAGNIDMVITKSISRFARNTVDCLQYIRQLKEKNIPVVFEKENINSMDAKGEIMLTIMASLAQQESQSISENVKMGIAFRNQNGEIRVNTNRFLGYTSARDEKNKKVLIIEPSEAEIIKRIYLEYLEGKSLLQICRGLESDGKRTGAKGTKWSASSVRRILQNEKYIGDALLAKTYTIDFLSKKRAVNTGEVPQYYVENSHEGIVPRELFSQVQEEMARRANLRNSTRGGKRVYSSRYALSSIVFCGECGDIYRRVHWNNRGKKSIVWRCVTRLEECGSDCASPTMAEADLHDKVVQTINQTITEREKFNTILLRNIETVVGKLPENLDDIQKRLEELQLELVRLSNNHDAYDGVVDEIIKLQQQKQDAMSRASAQDTLQHRMEDMAEFLKKHQHTLLEYDDTLARRLVEKVTVFENYITVLFRSGLEIEI